MRTLNDPNDRWRDGTSTEVRPTLVPLILLCTVSIVVGSTIILAPLRSASVVVALSSDPTGASAFLNGSLAGATPLLLQELRPGAYSLRLEKSGYMTETHMFTVARLHVALHETLSPVATAEVTVEVKPDGAEVLLDGDFQGHTPLHLERVPAGSHELTVSKPNYDSYTQRIDVNAGQPLVYKGFELGNKIMAMLKTSIAKERWRVAHYIDLAHYQFVNNRIADAAETYAQSLAVAGTEIEFPAEFSQQDRSLEIRLRAEDVNRLNEELRHKEHYPGKDPAAMIAFRNVINDQRELLTHTNYIDWKWVQAQVDSYVQDGRYLDAQTLLVKHIDTLKVGPNLDQAYMALLAVRLRLKTIKSIRESYEAIDAKYDDNPSLMRQAACAIYPAETHFGGHDRLELLIMAEKLLLKGLTAAQKSKNPEQTALLNFNLGNVLMLEERPDQAEPHYRASTEGTAEASNKEEWALKLVVCCKALKKWDDARKLLDGLIKSPRSDIENRARQELKAVDLLDPSPDNH